MSAKKAASGKGKAPSKRKAPVKTSGAAKSQAGAAKPKKAAAKSKAAGAKKASLLQLKVTLRDSRPPIWRRLQVPGEVTLEELHVIVQVAMGWEESHLHQFITSNGTYYSDPRFELEEVRDESRAQLSAVAGAPKSRLIYEYDFGDSWEHEIVVEKAIEPEAGATYPRCVDGKRAGPPEDVGGVWGYENLLEGLADKSHPEHEFYAESFPDGIDAEAFDRETVNRELGRMWSG